jgi:tetratricopeptide (TPR) repeat protein
MSKLLSALEERIALESDDYLRAEHRARKAAYLARTGYFQESKDEIAKVRLQFGDGRSGRVTVLIMIAEGLLLHFESLSTSALDRLARGQILAQAGRDQELIALTSAWKAFFEFERSEFEAAARSIGVAITSAANDDHASRLRIAAVLYTAWALSGDSAGAKKQFLRGREHALKEGDQAGLDALLHNKAVFSAARLRAQHCFEEVEPETVSLLRIEIGSARNLQQLARIRSLSSYIELADARLATVEGRYERSLALLEGLHGTGPFPKGHFGFEVGLIEQAFCLGKLGRLDEAIARAEPALHSDLADFDVDDAMVAKWQLAELSKIDSRFGSAALQTSKFEAAKVVYLSMTDRISRAFGSFANA